MSFATDEPFTPEVEVSLSPNQIMIFLTYYTIYEDDYVNEFIIEYIRMDLNFTVKWRTVSAKSNKAQVMEKIVDFAAGVQYKLRVWSTQSQQVCARPAVTVFTTGSAGLFNSCITAEEQYIITVQFYIVYSCLFHSRFILLI